MSNITNNNIERHPFQPLVSPNVKVMIIGSFPPPRSKWRMEFYYPNFYNDMWRIFGLAFFDNKEYFLSKNETSFDVELLKSFLAEKGIGIADMGKEIIRLRGNASDQFLKIVKPLNITELLLDMPKCHAFITAGQKATDTLRMHISNKIKQPSVGGRESFKYLDREFTIYRMPSSSRAYPMPVSEKAEIYRECFVDLGIV
ncbi:MAG TPA: uracil-DNA glycosylase family protein [Dysgonamonadaceae bacterium]|nr:uracil-DNA glycosylase family protein [Dysgonamonadaceae bacterium]